MRSNPSTHGQLSTSGVQEPIDATIRGSLNLNSKVLAYVSRVEASYARHGNLAYGFVLAANA